MKLVIDIPEEDYEYFKLYNKDGLYNAILNGKPLEQEPCEDAVSRKAVLETLDDMDNVLDEDRTVENYKELLKECYEVLPSVNSQNIGHWKEHRNRATGHIETVCSECGAEEGYPYNDYCGNCGAKMVEPQESEVKE